MNAKPEHSGEFGALGPCPHGDIFCPCQDGDSCHYERTPATVAMPCPTMPQGRRFGPHCHVEGCEWGPASVGTLTERRSLRADDCGILRIAPDTTLMDARRIGCGVIRAELALPGTVHSDRSKASP
jgi:hypothetical protein